MKLRQVPCLAVRGIPAMRAAVGEMGALSEGSTKFRTLRSGLRDNLPDSGLSSKSVFVTDREFFQMDRLRQDSSSEMPC